MKRIYIIFNANNLIGRLLCGLIYVLIYDFMYKNFVFQLFYYMGRLDYVEMNLISKILWIILSVLPMVVYNGLKSVSSFFSFFIYIFIYIPFIHALFVSNGISWQILSLYIIVFCCFILLFLQSGKKRLFFNDLELRPLLSIKFIEVITLIISITFLIIRSDSMHFVNIFTQMEELYELRSQNSDIGFVAYLQGWLSGAFYPFLLVCYMKQRNYLKISLIFIGYILLFMADMQKLTFVLPFILISLYILLVRKRDIICNKMHAFIIFSLVAFSLILFFAQDDELLFTLGSILLLRTVCVAGWLTQFYIHFFNENPYTYYSHINIVNFITGQYPYSMSLGQTVAYGTQNANANFILTDGVAACGVIGVFVISILFLFFLDFINAISYRYNKIDLFVVFLPSLSYILNTSLFTVLLSKGLIILLFLIISTKNPLVVDVENKIL